MKWKTTIATATLAFAGLQLTGCVAPDEVWPNFNKPDPAQAEKNIRAMGLCLRSDMQTIAVVTPTVFLVRRGQGHFDRLQTINYCFEAKTVEVHLVPIDPTQACGDLTFAASYTNRAGQVVTCPLAGLDFLMEDPELDREIKEISEDPHRPSFKY